MKVKKNLTFEESTVERVQRYADRRGISLSAAFSVLVNGVLDAQELWKKEDGSKLMQEYNETHTQMMNAIEKFLRE